MIETPQIVQSVAQQVACIHVTVPRSEIQQVMGPGIQEVMQAVAAQGIGPAGPLFNHYFSITEDAFDFEICVPVSAPVKPVGRVKPGRLESARVARTVYRGSYEGLGPAWGEFEAWIAAHGLKSGPDLWEVYLTGPESGPDPANWRTEFNRPLIG